MRPLQRLDGTMQETYDASMAILSQEQLVASVVLPALAPFLREHPAVQIAIHRDADRRVVEALAAGRVDFAISQEPSDTPGVADVRLGDEEFVMVESRAHESRRDVFLDV